MPMCQLPSSAQRPVANICARVPIPRACGCGSLLGHHQPSMESLMWRATRAFFEREMPSGWTIQVSSALTRLRGATGASLSARSSASIFSTNATRSWRRTRQNTAATQPNQLPGAIHRMSAEVEDMPCSS